MVMGDDRVSKLYNFPTSNGFLFLGQDITTNLKKEPKAKQNYKLEKHYRPQDN